MNNLVFMYELKPKYDRAKSFYHKAKVYANDKGTLFLMSYSTIVAEITDTIVANENNVKVYGYYSQTTARHINEFLQQNGYSKMNKKEMEGGV